MRTSRLKKSRARKNTMCSEDYDDNVTSKDPVTENAEGIIRKLIGWMLKLQRETGLADFYEKNLQNIAPEKNVYPSFTANPTKNRAQDVPCLEHSRLKLKELMPGECDYIHANYIIQPKKTDRVYIAAQHPMNTTISDFYRMVFYEKVETIVCLTKTNETDCPTYWPTEQGKFATYGTFFVNTRKVTPPAAKYAPTAYQIEILPDGCSNSSIITLLHYPHWAKDTLPPNARVIMKLLRAIKGGDKDHPVLISCDTGVNRTGLVIFADIFCQHVFTATDQNDVNIPVMVTKTFTDMRNDRACFIQNKLYFAYALYVFADYVRIRCKRYKIFPDIIAMVEEIEASFIKKNVAILSKEPPPNAVKEKAEE